MFGMFGATKIKSQIFVETTYAFRQFTNVNLENLNINEQGELCLNAYELLCAYEKKRNYSRVELILVGWIEAISFSSRDANTLSGKKIELLKGKADYLLSNEVIVSYDYQDPRYFPPFFTSFAIDDLDEIPDELSKLGTPIQQVKDKFST